MSKVTKTIAALGVVAGLGVAALPLASYAADTQNIAVEAKIGETLSVGTPTAAKVELAPTKCQYWQYFLVDCRQEFCSACSN